jgi:hypothetical protein
LNGVRISQFYQIKILKDMKRTISTQTTQASLVLQDSAISQIESGLTSNE